MDWVDDKETPATVETKAETKATESKAEGETQKATTEETKQTAAETTENTEGAQTTDETKDTATQETKATKEERTIPQGVFAKAIKKERDKYKEKLGDSSEEIRELRAEVERLKKGGTQQPETQTDPEDAKRQNDIAKQVRIQFLVQQDASGRTKYGSDYDDAVDLIKIKNPSLFEQIKWSAADPVESIMSEALRLSDEIEFGTDPKVRHKAIYEQAKKDLQKEFDEKLKALGNQPTSMSGMRAAGGDYKSDHVPETWATGKGALPS